jgi:general secretion pathway protein H
MSLRRRRASRAGFSLLEMLAVIAILALVAGLASQLARPPSPRLRVENAARALCAAMRATRMRALARNEETALTIDLRRKLYVSPAVAETALPREAALDVTVSSRERNGPNLAGVSFYPSGGSSGGEVTIVIDGARAQIDVNWLTGGTRCVLR